MSPRPPREEIAWLAEMARHRDRTAAVVAAIPPRTQPDPAQPREPERGDRCADHGEEAISSPSAESAICSSSALERTPTPSRRGYRPPGSPRGGRRTGK